MREYTRVEPNSQANRISFDEAAVEIHIRPKVGRPITLTVAALHGSADLQHAFMTFYSAGDLMNMRPLGDATTNITTDLHIVGIVTIKEA